MLPNDVDLSLIQRELTLYENPVQAPVAAGQQLGELTLFQGTLTAYEGNMVELLRCAGHLGPAAGADHPTPAGQMPGEICHSYALRPVCDQPLAASVQYHAQCVPEAGQMSGTLPHANEMMSAFN